MNIQSVMAGQEIHRLAPQQQVSSADAQQQFKRYLKEAIQDVNQAQTHSDQLTTQLVMGEQVALHEVMVAAQKASITLNATMEVRNKVVEAYQEMIRMQV